MKNVDFRKSKLWKEFRKEILEERRHTCEMCGTERRKGKGLHIHHLAPEAYTILHKPFFKVLCPACHRYILERFLRKKNWGKHEKVIMEWLYEYIPFGVRKKGYPDDYDKMLMQKEFKIKD